jgi:hypothetical protein
MPTVNIYHCDSTIADIFANFAQELRELLASELSCGARRLNSDELTVRLLQVKNLAMIAPVEIEITAHAYDDRLARADEICLAVREFVRDKIPRLEDVRVWLILSELGHSWIE